MKANIGLTVLAVLLAANAQAQNAKAQTSSGQTIQNTWYIGLTGDLSNMQNTDVKGPSQATTGKIEYDWGGGGNVAVGYKYDEATRIEIEGGYHYFPIDKVQTSTATNSNQDLKVVTLMANYYYDFEKYSEITPYLGAGLGVAHINFPRSTGFGNSNNIDNVFAYQGMLGVSYVPQSMPKTDWSIGYRYIGSLDSSFSGVNVDNLNSHSAEIGVKYNF